MRELTPSEVKEKWLTAQNVKPAIRESQSAAMKAKMKNAADIETYNDVKRLYDDIGIDLDEELRNLSKMV